MERDPRLEWVQRNRTRKERVVSAGDAVQRLVRNVEAGGIEVSPRVLESIAGVVDDEFRRHCRIVGGSQGDLIVQVDQGSWVYPMRVRWWPVLRKALSTSGGRGRISRITFRFGTSGIRLAGPGGTQD